MADTSDIRAGTELDEVKIVVNSLHLCMGFLLNRIEQINGTQAAVEARQALLENIENGTIDMAIMEDKKIHQFVVSLVEQLPYKPETAPV